MEGQFSVEILRESAAACYRWPLTSWAQINTLAKLYVTLRYQLKKHDSLPANRWRYDEAALRTKRRRCKRFANSRQIIQEIAHLCDALAKMARRLKQTIVDPRTIEQLLANRLIPLDKGEGAVRPIGVGEVIRRVIGKCVTKVTKQDVISGSLQVAQALSTPCTLYSKLMRRMLYSWFCIQCTKQVPSQY